MQIGVVDVEEPRRLPAPTIASKHCAENGLALISAQFPAWRPVHNHLAVGCLVGPPATGIRLAKPEQATHHVAALRGQIWRSGEAVTWKPSCSTQRRRPLKTRRPHSDQLASPSGAFGSTLVFLFSLFLSLCMKVKMRWLPAFLSAVFATGAFAAKKTTEQRFTEFHTKALSSAPVKLLDASYRELTSSPRDYTAAILLTALDPRFACQLCREFQPEWELLSRSWTKGDKVAASRVIYATLDFSDGRDIFMSVCWPCRP
jgi:hypothetical protein